MPHCFRAVERVSDVVSPLHAFVLRLDLELDDRKRNGPLGGRVMVGCIRGRGYRALLSERAVCRAGLEEG